MKSVKEVAKSVLGYIWRFIKMSFPSMIAYSCTGAILLMLTIKKDSTLTWESQKIIFTCLAWALAIAYNAVLANGYGGMGYQMLVAGNMKRRSQEDGTNYKLSTHKEEEEYRPWKGFAVGFFASLPMIIGAIVFGVKGDVVNTMYAPVEQTEASMGIFVLIVFMISGLSLLPAFFCNASGIAFNYYLTMIFALVPILIWGIFYIVGAYAKRNKVLHQRQVEEEIRQAKENKDKKINYGGLPGTKPKRK